jgi:hypothetical protein
MQFGYQIPSDIGHISLFVPEGTGGGSFAAIAHFQQIQRTLLKNVSTDPYCTVLTI